MSRRLPPRMLRRLILSALLGVAFGVAAWYLGMDAAHAIGLGAAAFAITACLSALGEAADVSWGVPAPQPRQGARRDIVQLGWSLGARGGRASPEGVRRLRTVAERALLLRGLDLEDRTADTRLEALLGADALRLLRRGSGVAPPRTSEVSAVLARLESLAAEDDLASGNAGAADAAPARRPRGGDPVGGSRRRRAPDDPPAASARRSTPDDPVTAPTPHRPIEAATPHRPIEAPTSHRPTDAPTPYRPIVDTSPHRPTDHTPQEPPHAR